MAPMLWSLALQSVLAFSLTLWGLPQGPLKKYFQTKTQMHSNDRNKNKTNLNFSFLPFSMYLCAPWAAVNTYIVCASLWKRCKIISLFWVLVFSGLLFRRTGTGTVRRNNNPEKSEVLRNKTNKHERDAKTGKERKGQESNWKSDKKPTEKHTLQRRNFFINNSQNWFKETFCLTKCSGV